MTTTTTTTDSVENVVVTGESKKTVRKRRTPDTSYLKAPKMIPGGAVVCISRLPHGFYETELRSYLSQFGEITRLRISRNPRTGASRHYAFAEFRHADVAKIVAETMQNYLLMGHLLKCKVLGEEEIHEELWKGANRKFAKVPWRKLEKNRYNDAMEKKDEKTRRTKATTLLTEKRQICEKIGLEYDFDGVLSGSL